MLFYSVRLAAGMPLGYVGQYVAIAIVAMCEFPDTSAGAVHALGGATSCCPP